MEWRYLNGSAAMGERSCGGEVGYERKDRVLEKGIVGGRGEAALALKLGTDQGGLLARSGATEERGVKAALNSAINPCWARRR